MDEEKVVHISEIIPGFTAYRYDVDVFFALYVERIMMHLGYTVELNTALYEQRLLELDDYVRYAIAGFPIAREEVLAKKYNNAIEGILNYFRDEEFIYSYINFENNPESAIVTMQIGDREPISLRESQDNALKLVARNLSNIDKFFYQEDRFRNPKGGNYVYNVDNHTNKYTLLYAIALHSCLNYVDGTNRKVIITYRGGEVSRQQVDLIYVKILGEYIEDVAVWDIAEQYEENMSWDLYCASYRQKGMMTPVLASDTEAKYNYVIGTYALNDVVFLYGCDKKKQSETGPVVNSFSVGIIKAITPDKISIVKVANENLQTIEKHTYDLLNTHANMTETEADLLTKQTVKPQDVSYLWKDVGIDGYAFSETNYMCKVSLDATDRVEEYIGGEAYDLSTIEAIYTVLIDRGVVFNIQSYYDNYLKPVLVSEGKTMPTYNKVKNIAVEYTE